MPLLLNFNLDTPTRRALGRCERFSGWCLQADGRPFDELYLRVNGCPAAVLDRTPRWDVARAFPDLPEAVLGGFIGDLALPHNARKGDHLAIEVVSRDAGRETVLWGSDFVVDSAGPVPGTRHRSYDLEAILENVPVATDWMTESSSWPAYVLGVPHYHDPGTIPCLRALEPGPTHPYSADAIQVLDAVPPHGTFLDLGCGIRHPDDIRENGIYLDAVHYRGVDVVNTRPRLPLRDACVDAVVSLAVFEHLPDPFGMAAELWRVLKPGGTVWIETAFMQPLHADPGHFFNMTMDGLRRVFSRFTIDASGTQSHQTASNALTMQIEHVLPYMNEGEWKAALSSLQQRLHLDGRGLDEALGPIGRRTLAAGFYIRGRKTG